VVGDLGSAASAGHARSPSTLLAPRIDRDRRGPHSPSAAGISAAARRSWRGRRTARRWRRSAARTAIGADRACAAGAPSAWAAAQPHRASNCPAAISPFVIDGSQRPGRQDSGPISHILYRAATQGEQRRCAARNRSLLYDAVRRSAPSDARGFPWLS
jgi:hypothetical protein